MRFIAFVTSIQGRMARVVMGLVLLSMGLLVLQPPLGTVLALIALIPIAGGVFDFCLAGVAMGYPFQGAKAREQLVQARLQR